MLNYAWLIVWLPLFGFLFNALVGKKAGKTAVAWIAPGVVLAAFVLAILVLQAVLATPSERVIVPLIPGTPATTPWINFGHLRANFAMLLDPLSMLMVLIVTGVGGLIHVYATGYMADDPEQPRFFTYFNLFIFMMLLLVTGENFLLMFVGWEGVGTCSYLLISFWYTDNENAKAGNKAFIVNRVGDVGFALGMMAVWSVFGTLSFYTPHATGVMDMALKHVDALGGTLAAPTVTLICCLLFVGAIGKSAQIPLWVWLPDAMAGPTPVSALIHAATMVTAGVVMVTRCSALFVLSPDALRFVGIVGLATAFMAATIALVQNDIKRVLAYSTISQLGYMFLACGVGDFAAGMFHVTTHAFFKALLFLGSGAVIHSMLGEQDMRKMGGLRQKLPTTWLVMLAATYAIAGFPLLSGFWSKDAILDSASKSAWGGGAALYGAGLFTALLTAFYMNRLMWKTFYTEPRYVDGELHPHLHGNFPPDAEHGEALRPAGAHGAEHEPPAVHDAGSGIDAQNTAPSATTNAEAHPGAHGGRIHPSPLSMMLPLYVLAIASVVAGAALGPWSGNLFATFLDPSVAHLSQGPLKHEAPDLISGDYTGYIISSIVAILGLALAAFVYRRHMRTGNLIPEETEDRWAAHPSGAFGFAYSFLFNKWWWDALYNKVFIGVGGWFADRILWKTVDVGLIDATVNGGAGGVGLLSRAIRRLQTGYVRNYALSMLLGVVVLVAGLLYTWNKLVTP